MTGALLVARTAGAQDAGSDAATVPNCNTLPNPVYLSGSSAFEATVQNYAVKLSALSSGAVTVVYNLPMGGSCDGVAALSGNTDISGTAHYYTLVNNAVSVNPCNLTSGIKADVAVSDVFWESCNNGAKPATFTDFVGPAQAMLFIVPELDTSVTNITYEEAQLVYGCGMAGNITPFTMDAGIFRRNPTSGTQITIAKNIGLAAGALKGFECTGSGDMANHVTGYANPANAIGFIAADAYESRRTALNALAFRAKDQTLAYYADSTAGTADRRNVRDGHYTVWGYEHMFAAATGNTPTSAGAATVIGYILGTTTTDASIDYVAIDGKAGTIPLCAMKVQRATDGGDLSYSVRNGDTCDCAFEAALSQSTPTGCAPCTGTGVSTCTGGLMCHHGYCE
jgi:ABC-type phosphate transport system substrate-binding protein